MGRFRRSLFHHRGGAGRRFARFPLPPFFAAALAAAAMLVSAACAPADTAFKQAFVDLKPPEILDWAAGESSALDLLFDEPVRCEARSIAVSPPLPIGSVDAREVNGLRISFASPQVPGTEYAVCGSVEDADGNSVQFVLPFSGFNGRVPRVLINEFTTQGSGKHPDCVELVVLEGGDTAGVAFFVGTKNKYAQRLVLPSAEVGAGDFIVIHTKPQGLPEEIDETGADLAASGGYDASGARDLWLRLGTGLSGSNGVLSLYASSTGRLLDAVFYTNRTSESDSEYDGFGSEALRSAVREIVGAGGWKITGGDPAPEDGVPSAGGTSTRSLCRSSVSDDADLASDWHLVPTKGVSLGAPNSDETYAAPLKDR